MKKLRAGPRILAVAPPNCACQGRPSAAVPEPAFLHQPCPYGFSAMVACATSSKVVGARVEFFEREPHDAGQSMRIDLRFAMQDFARDRIGAEAAFGDGGFERTVRSGNLPEYRRARSGSIPGGRTRAPAGPEAVLAAAPAASRPPRRAAGCRRSPSQTCRGGRRRLQ